MSTDLTFFESYVPIVPTLYQIFVAVGWGLLIGNCAFQSLKAMFAGLGFETESPAILLLRTFLFGTLLIFSKDICDIGLSIGKNIIELLDIPSVVSITMPDETFFIGINSSWVLVVIIGFILGFQLIKLFFEIAERYVVVSVLTLLCPVGLAMGGSKSTKDICTGFIRTYASMITMMVMNVLFLKLILSALAAMPSGIMVLPWCLLVVGIAKTARKADNLISKIGLSPAITGDPLGSGRGITGAMMTAKTIMNAASRSGNGNVQRNKPSDISAQNSSRCYSSGNTTQNRNSGTDIHNTHTNSSSANTASSSVQHIRTQNAHANGVKNTSNNHSVSTVHSNANSYGNTNHTVNSNAGKKRFGSSGQTRINTDRFNSQTNTAIPPKSNPAGQNKTAGNISKSTQTPNRISDSGIGNHRFGGQVGALKTNTVRSPSAYSSGNVNSHSSAAIPAKSNVSANFSPNTTHSQTPHFPVQRKSVHQPPKTQQEKSGDQQKKTPER